MSKPIEETIVSIRSFFAVPAPSLEPVRRTMSDRIRIARGLCIFFMIFVHVPPGIGGNVYDRDASFFDLVYFVLTRLAGLSSVSLLSVVSGFFIVSSLAKAGARPLLMSKLRRWGCRCWRGIS